MSDREKCLKNVQRYSFAVTEAALFLDTHPDCSEALAYYNKYKKLPFCTNQRTHNIHFAQYRGKYGPLSISSDANEKAWQWANGPWPWELAANEEV